MSPVGTSGSYLIHGSLGPPERVLIPSSPTDRPRYIKTSLKTDRIYTMFLCFSLETLSTTSVKWRHSQTFLIFSGFDSYGKDNLLLFMPKPRSIEHRLVTYCILSQGHGIHTCTQLKNNNAGYLFQRAHLKSTFRRFN